MVKESVKRRIGGVVVTAWKFWPLVHCITYSVIPAHYRILWVNVVDLVWIAILADMSNQKDQPVKATMEPVEQVLKQEAALMDAAANETAVAVGVEEAVTEFEEVVGVPFLLRQKMISSVFGTNSSTLFSAELEDEVIEILPAIRCMPSRRDTEIHEHHGLAPHAHVRYSSYQRQRPKLGILFNRTSLTLRLWKKPYEVL